LWVLYGTPCYIRVKCTLSFYIQFISVVFFNVFTNVVILLTSAGHTRKTKRCPRLFDRLMDAKTGVWTIRNTSRRHASKSPRKDPFGLQNLPLDSAVGPEQHDVFYTNMAPVVQLLRAMGALPIRTLPVDSRAAAGNWYGNSYAYYVMKLVPEPSVFEVEMVIGKLKRHRSSGIHQTPANCLKQGVEQFARRSINLLIIFRLRRNCLKSVGTRSMYLLIWRVIKQSVVNIEAYHFYQLRTKCYPTSCCED